MPFLESHKIRNKDKLKLQHIWTRTNLNSNTFEQGQTYVTLMQEQSFYIGKDKHSQDSSSKDKL